LRTGQPTPFLKDEDRIDFRRGNTRRKAIKKYNLYKDLQDKILSP
jgi:hypothetical protein